MERQRVRCVHRADAHQCRHRGDPKPGSELAQLGRRAGIDDAAAGVDQWAFTLSERIEKSLRVLGSDAGVVNGSKAPVVTDQLEPLFAVIWADPVLNVLRNVHHDRTRPAGARDVESRAHGGFETLGFGHEKRVFGAHTHEIEDGRFLECIGAEGGAGHLSGD